MYMNNLKNNYFYSLDIFRGFCGYGVAICHLNAFAFGNAFLEYSSLLFVEFFFVLSGFVLYPQLLKVINNNKNLFIFYKRRWIRTLPLYIVILIAVSALTNQLFTLDFFKYLTLTQKFLPEFIGNDYFPVAWSLSIEEIFYLLFPILLIFLNKKNFLFYVFLCFFLLLTFKFLFVSKINADFYRTGTFLRLDSILFGFILAHYKNIIISNRFIILSICLFSLSIYLGNYQFFIFEKELPIIKVIFIIFMQLTSASVLFSFILIEPFLKNKIIKKIGLIISSQTYSIYLIHIILIYLFKKLDFNILLTNSLYLLSLFIISFLVYNYFEKPLLQLRPKIK